MSSFWAAASEVSARPAMTWSPASWLLCLTLVMSSSIAASTSLWMISSDVSPLCRPSRPGAPTLPPQPLKGSGNEQQLCLVNTNSMHCRHSKKHCRHLATFCITGTYRLQQKSVGSPHDWGLAGMGSTKKTQAQSSDQASFREQSAGKHTWEHWRNQEGPY